MKKTFLMACGIILAASCVRENLDEKIYRQTREYTRTSCPKQMDQYTVLDSMVYIPGSRTMVYHYAVSDKMDVDSVYTSEMINLFDANLLNNIRQNPGLNELKEHAVTFQYIYASQANGSAYMTFTYAPEDYKPGAR